MRFIRERAESGDYERHLGLISMIQRDLATLSNLMAPPTTDGKPRERDEKLPQLDRVVLYIDDLDRCPSHLVVEVLQAVHLLLAYPLFVVVVGVDPRWLVSSLSRHHSALFGSEGAIGVVVDEDDTANYTAKPQEYLEKIFQLPLILKPMEEHGYGRLVSELLPVRAEETHDAGADGGREQSDGTRSNGHRTTQTTGSTEDEDFDPGHRNLHIEPAEIDLVKQLWPIMPSPRAVKRLSNVYRFVRAQVPPHELPAFTAESEPHGDYPAVLFLLAVLIGLPDDAPAVLRVICDDKHKTWKDVVADTSACHRRRSTSSGRQPKASTTTPLRRSAPRCRASCAFRSRSGTSHRRKANRSRLIGRLTFVAILVIGIEMRDRVRREATATG